LFALKETEVIAEVGEDINSGRRGRRDERYMNDTEK
jgi:hypothetical protein